MVELIVIMILLGILGATALPHLIGNNDTPAQVFGDRLVSGLRLAQKSALARRRLVCVAMSASAITLRVADVTSPSPTAPCPKTLATAPDSEFASGSTNVTASGLSGTLYFQPNGDITTDLAGAAPARGNVTVSAAGTSPRVIQLEGSTGYVE